MPIISESMSFIHLTPDYLCSVVDTQRSCAIVLSSHPLHLMISSGTSPVGCGTKTRPWMIEAPVGQKINMRLIDLSRKSPEDMARSSVNGVCSHAYGYILEKSHRRNITICSGKERKTHLYSTTGNVADLILKQESSTEKLMT